MKNPKRLSVALVAVLMVLAAGCTAVGFTTDTGADTNAQMQQNAQAVEPNDNRENATPIEFGAGPGDEDLGAVYGQLNHTVENETVVEEDVDFFKFNASAGQAINVYVKRGGVEGPVNVTLFDPSGEVVDSAVRELTADSTIGGVADETGTYYVRVRSTQPVPPVESMSYSFLVETADQDAFEPNDAIANATPIDSGDHVNGTIAKGDTDVFAVEADAGETITASIALRDTVTVNQGNVAIDILNANGERLNDVSGVDGDKLTNTTDLTSVSARFETESVNVTVEEDGTYYVRVTEAPSSSDLFDIGGFLKYGLDVETSGAAETPTVTPTETPEETDTSEETETPAATETPQPTTAAPTETPTETETATLTPTETSEKPTEQPAEEGVTYYQVDFVVGEPIENLRGPEGTYAASNLIRFVHGSTGKPVTRRAPGAFAYAESNVEERIGSQRITVENGTATVTFTVAEGSKPLTLSLVSYEKPGPGWSPETESEQEFVDAQTETLGPGTYTLTVELPGSGDGAQTATESGEGQLSVVGLSADADGNDNDNLNDEYIVYENTGDAPLDLSGWTVTDASGATFTFPDGFTLAPGEQVTLYTGSGTNTESALYWGQANGVWNNGADTMTVRNAAGEIVLQRSYP